MASPVELVELDLEELGEHFGRLRVHTPDSERGMARSMRLYGQLSPVVVCLRERRYELIDGFKRLAAARSLDGWARLLARVMAVDDKAAKAAIYGLNRAGGKTKELEEAWIVYALVREDGVPTGRSCGASGPAQDMGMPPTSLGGKPFGRGEGGTPCGVIDSDGGASRGAIAPGQPKGVFAADPS